MEAGPESANSSILSPAAKTFLPAENAEGVAAVAVLYSLASIVGFVENIVVPFLCTSKVVALPPDVLIEMKTLESVTSTGQ